MEPNELRNKYDLRYNEKEQMSRNQDLISTLLDFAPNDPCYNKKEQVSRNKETFNKHITELCNKWSLPYQIRTSAKESVGVERVIDSSFQVKQLTPPGDIRELSYPQ